MAQVAGLHAAESAVAVMVGNEVLQCLLPGDEGGLKHVVNEIDFGADASGLGIGQVRVHIDQDLTGLVQLLHHFVQIVSQRGEAAHDDQTRHRHTHSGKGHKSMKEDAAEALLQKVSKIIQLHLSVPPLFRR